MVSAREGLVGLVNSPIIGKLEADNLRDYQGVLQRQAIVCLIHSTFQQARSYCSLVLFGHCTTCVSDVLLLGAEMESVLGSRLSPVLVDTVLKLDNGEVADLEW